MNQIAISVGSDLEPRVLDVDDGLLARGLLKAPDLDSYVAGLLPWALTPGDYVVAFDWSAAPRFLGVRDLDAEEQAAAARQQPVLHRVQARVQPVQEPVQNRRKPVRQAPQSRVDQVVVQALRQLGYQPAEAQAAAQRASAELPGAPVEQVVRRALALALKE